MQVFQAVWFALIVACTIIYVAFNSNKLINSPATPFALAPKIDLLPRKLMNSSGAAQLATAVAPELLAFVGVFTALRPERRRSLRDTWFPSSLEQLDRFVS